MFVLEEHIVLAYHVFNKVQRNEIKNQRFCQALLEKQKKKQKLGKKNVRHMGIFKWKVSNWQWINTR